MDYVVSIRVIADTEEEMAAARLLLAQRLPELTLPRGRAGRKGQYLSYGSLALPALRADVEQNAAPERRVALPAPRGKR